MRKPDEGGRQLDESIAAEAQAVTDILNRLRQNTRQQQVSAGGGYGQYVVGPLTQPPPPPPAPAPTNGPAPPQEDEKA